jgi:hypothetical protein
MHYRIKSSLTAITLILLMTSCYEDDYFPCIRPAGPVYEETRITSTFHSVTISVNAEVYIDYAPYNSVVIAAAGNILDEISSTTPGRTLHIDNMRCLRNKSTDVVIYITTPTLNTVKLHSSGNIYIDGFEGNRTTVELTSSGNITYSGMDFDKVHSILSGSGNIRLSGVTYENVLQISGSGNVLSYDLFSDEAFVQISGSGDARVNVFRFLDARISGSGRVLYKGNPNVHAVITGSGSITKTK